jgi:hypothetical protein
LPQDRIKYRNHAQARSAAAVTLLDDASSQRARTSFKVMNQKQHSSQLDEGRIRAISPVHALLGFLIMAGQSAAAESDLFASRYPTSDEPFYVLACMEMNGQNAERLQKRSCAITAIEAELPYEQYSEAVLVFAMAKRPGKERYSTEIWSRPTAAIRAKPLLTRRLH